MAKTYGQFCGLARALDRIGDRWTLLIIRELLLGEASYGALLETLEGIPTNLLARRLRELEEDGLVTREREQEDRRRVGYRLTPLGAEIEPALLALIRWGGNWMATGPAGDRFDPRWAWLAVRAILEGRSPPVRGTVEIQIDGASLGVVCDGNTPLRVEPGPVSGKPAASVSGDSSSVLGLLSGALPLAEATRKGLRIRGDRALVRGVLRP